MPSVAASLRAVALGNSYWNENFSQNLRTLNLLKLLSAFPTCALLARPHSPGALRGDVRQVAPCLPPLSTSLVKGPRLLEVT